MENAFLGSLASQMMADQVINDKMQQQQEQLNNQQNQKSYDNQFNKKQAEMDDLDMEFDAETEEILQRMKQERLKEINQNQMKQKEKDNTNRGEYREIVQDEFLPYVTKNDQAVVHFYHQDFERCKIVDKHLRIIALEHPETSFTTINSEKAPFFIQKLGIKTLPTICLFKKGLLIKQIIGFEELNGNDAFQTIELSRLIVKYDVMQARKQSEKGFQLKKGKKKNNENSDSDDDF